MIRQLLFLLLLSAVQTLLAQPNQNCDNMSPICTDPGITFTANTGVSIGPGNTYDCLITQPNPTWYYFEIDNSGDILMNLYAPSDVDFIIYGPFNNLPTAISLCGSMGISVNAPIVDCSYSPTNDEFPTVTGAQSGEIYVLLITNYASVVQPITLTQVGGTGTTLCDSVYAACADAGTYTLLRNGVPKTSPLTLYLDDQLDIFSNGNYVLPAETIPQPVGDGIYSAQILWLIYDTAPIGNEPSLDPGFTFEIIPGDSLTDVNNSSSSLVQNFGCGSTLWLVPVTADDGIGGNNNMANGTTDNGGLHWDRNGNDCYELGTPFEITFDCAAGNSEHAGLGAPADKAPSLVVTHEQILLKELSADGILNLYDLSGRVLYSAFISANETYHLVHIPGGSYICQFATDHYALQKVVIVP